MPHALKLLATLALVAISAAARADGILIYDDDFAKYLKDAKPGDVFTVYPGLYKIAKPVSLEANGTADQPIIIKPADGAKVTIEVSGNIGFKILGAYWTVEGFDFEGACENHSKCEHAIQIVGEADHTTIRNNRMIDFNAAIKGNGHIVDNRQYFPDHVLIEDNVIYNRTPRQTANPVVPVDVVGGRFWTLRGNFIADFEKALGNRVSMAGFLKGNSDNGVFERNVVICEWRHHGGVRLGLSLGGGGTTDPKYCQGRSCKIEHYKGLIQSNLIMNCPADVGIYLNNAANTKIVNNTILNTAGVDVRFNGSFATFSNNVIEGRIKDRDGGRHREERNLVKESLGSLFPGLARLDLSPKDADDLEDAERGYEAPDLCDGKPQEKWLGAFKLPLKCSVADMAAKIDNAR